MIDANKIEKATRDYFAKYNFFAKYDEDTCYDIEFAYKDGAHWAINEFLKDLLHPVSEIPHSKDGYCSIYIFCKNKNINNVLYIEKENVWRELIDGHQGVAWCYINDLFPKKRVENGRT